MVRTLMQALLLHWLHWPLPSVTSGNDIMIISNVMSLLLPFRGTPGENWSSSTAGTHVVQYAGLPAHLKSAATLPCSYSWWHTMNDKDTQGERSNVLICIAVHPVWGNHISNIEINTHMHIVLPLPNWG